MRPLVVPSLAAVLLAGALGLCGSSGPLLHDAAAGPLERRSEELLAGLATRRLSEVKLENASLDDLVTWLRTVTGWNFLVKRTVIDKAGIDLAAIRVNLTLHDVTVGLVLDFVLGHHGLVAKVEGNIVFVTTKADAMGKPLFRLYDVRHLTWQKIDFVGPDIDLLPSGFDAGEAAPKEVPVEDDPFLDPQHIVDLVKEMVPGEWDAEGWGLTATKTYLAVRAPLSIQRRVALALEQMAAMK